jgi:hypothetical protein
MLELIGRSSSGGIGTYRAMHKPNMKTGLLILTFAAGMFAVSGHTRRSTSLPTGPRSLKRSTICSPILIPPAPRSAAQWIFRCGRSGSNEGRELAKIGLPLPEQIRHIGIAESSEWCRGRSADSLMGIELPCSPLLIYERVCTVVRLKPS